MNCHYSSLVQQELAHGHNRGALGQPIEATGIRIVVPRTGLGRGTAIDEIEVYTAQSLEQPDIVFGASLHAAEVLDDSSGILFNEVAAAQDADFFVELVNRGARDIDLSGYKIVNSRQNAPPRPAR